MLLGKRPIEENIVTYRELSIVSIASDRSKGEDWELIIGLWNIDINSDNKIISFGAVVLKICWLCALDKMWRKIFQEQSLGSCFQKFYFIVRRKIWW